MDDDRATLGRMLASGEGEITLYDGIDSLFGISPAAVRDALKELSAAAAIHVRINSPGGSVFDGIAIYNLLRSAGARKIVHIDGVAASIASVVAMAGDEIEMGRGALLMVHNPMTLTIGEADDLRDEAALLDLITDQIAGIYAARSGRPAAELRALMDEETWLDADQAIALGLADRAVDQPAIAAHIPPGRFRRVPANLLLQEHPVSHENTPAPATYAELKAAFPKADAAFLCAQLEAGATLDAARAAWQDALEARAAAAEAAAETARQQAAAAEARAQKGGVSPVPTTETPPAATEEPRAAWDAAIAAQLARGKTRAQAVAAVSREQPQLREALLAAANAN